MSKVNEHRKGYKHTPLGWIPEEWEVRKLCSIADIQQGISKGKEVDASHLVNVPYMRVANVKEGYLDLEEIKFIDVDSRNYQKYLLRKGDILITEGGDPDKLGRGAIWNNEVTDCIYQNHLFRIRPLNGSLLAPYFYQFLQGKRARTYFLNCAKQTTGIASINSFQVNEMPLAIPSNSEQRRIIAILSTWDEAIAKTQQLISLLRQRNKGLMQQLLTGRSRLNKFDKPWIQINFGEVFKFIKSFPISRDGLVASGKDDSMLYCIHYGDIHTLYRNQFLDFSTQLGIPRIKQRDITIDDGELLKEGDIIIADASEDYEGVGVAVEVLNLGNKKAVAGLHTLAVRDSKSITVPLFRAFLFSGEGIRNQLRKRATGTSVYSVSKSTMISLLISIPGIEEQQRISEVLSRATEELDIHEKRLFALQQQKKGLMQKLLTGEIRVNPQN